MALAGGNLGVLQVHGTIELSIYEKVAALCPLPSPTLTIGYPGRVVQSLSGRLASCSLDKGSSKPFAGNIAAAAASYKTHYKSNKMDPGTVEHAYNPCC